jgi:hypothetical protein
MNPDFAGIGDPDTNLLEECAELIQALTKLSRFGSGIGEYDNLARVRLEMADVRQRMIEWESAHPN